MSALTADIVVFLAKGYDHVTQACVVTLAFSITLLDHTLKRHLFESTLVEFLAVLGIDVKQQTFLKLYSYTSYLSGLVKMAQMLVVLQAVQLAEPSKVSHPADALDETRGRFA